MSTDKSCPDQDVLEQLLLGRVPAEEAVDLEDHLAGCERCAERAGEISSEDELIVALQAKQLPPEDDGRISELIEQLRKVNADAETSRLGDTYATTVHLSASTQPGLSELLDPPETPEEIGRIGHYRVLDVLGAGGMGLVLRARDPHLKRTVAIKVMKGDVAADESAKSRFLREAQATAAIEHDNIVTIYQVAEHRGLPYYAMQFLRGESLEDRLKREGGLDQAEVLRIGREIAAGLAAAHAEGLLHRDIKPDNIWLEEKTGRAKIVDFGLARDTKDEENITLSGMVLGTPRYMAPEQALGQTVDHRCDLFSLGSVMYHLAAGQPPFKADNLAATLMAVVNKQPPPMADLQPEIDEELVHVIDRLLAKEPDSRFQSAAEVVEAIRRVEQRLEADARRQQEEAHSQPTFGELHFQRQKRRRVLMGTALGAFSLAIVFGIIFFIQTQTGTVRVEVNDKNLEVLIDGQKITLTDKKGERRKRVAMHRLAIKLGDETLDIGQATVFEVDGRDIEHHLTVKLNGFDITSNEFEVLRGDSTALTISLERRTRQLADSRDDATEGTTASSTPRGWGVWSEPVNLGPVVNSTAHDSGPCLSADGLSLLFYSAREGGLGGNDIWMCTRSSTEEAWSKPENLGPVVNSKGTEQGPSLSSDGLTLLFASDRTGGLGWTDIWMCKRAAVGDAWSPAVNLGPNINSRMPQTSPKLSADGLTLVFVVYWNKGRLRELFASTRRSAAEPWSEREKIREINSASNDASPSLSADGRTLLFQSTRGGKENLDLWMSTHASAKEPWSTPVNLGPRINSPQRDGGPILSTDGRTLIFQSDRPGGAGGIDLWMSTRLDPPLAVAPFDETAAKEHQQAWAEYLGLPVEKEVELPGGEKMTFMLIPPGEFLMGSTAEEQAEFLEKQEAKIPDESPQHHVRLTRPFYLGKCEVTQAQWQVVMGTNPSVFDDDPTHPVENVSWDDIQPFLAKLNEGASAGTRAFALPTEAQWEYACRAGTTKPYYSGESENDLRGCGWFDANSGGKTMTRPVRKLQANGFGLYDMHGNVWEWCADWFAAGGYARAPVDDPTGPSAGLTRVHRGGAWSSAPLRCRAASRGRNTPDERRTDLGFRLAMTIDTAKPNASPPLSGVVESTITPEDGWVDLLAAVDVSRNTASGGWWIEDGELAGYGEFDLPIRPRGNFEWEIEFTATPTDRWIAFHIPHPNGRPYAAVNLETGLLLREPADSEDWTRLIRGASAVSLGERHTLKISQGIEDGKTSIVAEIDGKPWAEWAGDSELLATRAAPLEHPRIDTPLHLMTVHSSRLRMLDGEASLLRAIHGAQPDASGPPPLVRERLFFADGRPVRFTPDGRSVLTIRNADGRLMVLDAQTGAEIRRSDQGMTVDESTHVHQLAVSPVASLVAGGNSEGQLVLLDYDSGELRHELEGHAEGIANLQFSPDGGQLLSISRDRTIRVWDVLTGEQRQQFDVEYPVPGRSALAISPDGRHFAQCSRTELSFRDFQSRDVQWTASFKPTRIAYSMCVFSGDGGRLAMIGNVPGQTCLLALFDTRDGREIWKNTEIPAPLAAVTNLRYLANDRCLLSVHYPTAEHAVCLWDAATGQLLQRIDGAVSGDVSPDGKSVVTIGPGPGVHIWHLDEENLAAALANAAKLAPTAPRTPPDWHWSEPEPIEEVNSESDESGPTISADGLTMVFVSRREGGDHDLWISERNSVDDRWGKPQRLGPEINWRSTEDVQPELSSDGLTLLFARREPKIYNLFVTTRASRDAPWQAAEGLGKPVNTTHMESFPSLTADGLTLVFSSNRPGSLGDADKPNSDLWISHRESIKAPWGEPVNMGSPVNTGGAELGSCLSSDGLTMLFTARGTALSGRLMSTRESLDSPWREPKQLPSLFQPDARDNDIELSSDGREVYLSLNGNIHVIRRVPK